MLRIGHGYDVHRLVKGRQLVLGGVTVPYEMGLDGHSDADVLVHAVMDSLIGAAALGDIGIHFPDSDPKYKNADSIKLLKKTVGLLAEKGYTINNIDSSIICQKPKLMVYIPDMRKNIAAACGCELSAVNVKATTEEGLGFTGAELGIAAHAVCLIEKNG